MLRRTDSSIGLSSLKELQPFKIKQLKYIIIVFILSRLLFFYVGIRFDTIFLAHFWQYIDLPLLKNNLFQSIYYLHSQPPLFNMFLGFVLKIFATNAILVFNILYLFFGLIFTISLFLLMTKLGVPDKLSAILTVLFVISPACILYENWLFYTYPTATLLCLSALFLHKFLVTQTIKNGFIFFTLLSLIVLTRSIFHLLWFVLFVLILLFYERYNWKIIAFACCIPLMVILLLYAKNIYIFGNSTSSSWFGMNLSRMTVMNLSENERASLIQQGKISELSLIPPFSGLEVYQDYLPRIKKTNIPVLDQEVKVGGATNFNNIVYIDISKQYLKDAVYVLIFYPKAYLKGLMLSYWNYFRPSGNYWFLKGNRKHIQNMDRFYNLIFYGQLLNNDNPILKDGTIIQYDTHKFLNMGLFLVIGYPILAFYGFFLTLKAFSRNPIDLPFALTMLFIWINIIYVTLVGNSFELHENNRFRFMIDPFFLVFLGLFINTVLLRISWRKPDRFST